MLTSAPSLTQTRGGRTPDPGRLLYQRNTNGAINTKTYESEKIHLSTGVYTYKNAGACIALLSNLFYIHNQARGRVEMLELTPAVYTVQISKSLFLGVKGHRFMNKPVSYGIVVGLFAILAVSGMLAFREHQKEQGVLKMAHGLEDTHPVHQSLLFMQKRLSELSGGTIKLDIYPNAVMGGEIETLEQVQAGQLAMTKVSTAALEAQLPETRVFGLPFIFRDKEHYWKVLEGSIGKQMLEAGRTHGRGFFGLCYYDAGARSFYSTKKQIYRVKDVEGLKVRVMSSPTAFDMIRAMGGSPCPTVWGELYTALAQGTVDAAENNPPSFVTSRHYEVCKLFSLSEHQRVPDMLVFSTLVWETLTPEQQVIFRQAAKESQDYQRELWQAKTDEAMIFLKQEGVHIITPDIEIFRNACRSMIDSQAYADVKALAKAIEEVQ